VKTLVLKQCPCEEDIEKLVPKIGSCEEDSKNLDPELDFCEDDSETKGYKARLSRQEDKEPTVSTKGEKYTARRETVGLVHGVSCCVCVQYRTRCSA
jgi:hypothetical protein